MPDPECVSFRFKMTTHQVEVCPDREHPVQGNPARDPEPLRHAQWRLPALPTPSTPLPLGWLPPLVTSRGYHLWLPPLVTTAGRAGSRDDTPAFLWSTPAL
jgi:hypothetical protein